MKIIQFILQSWFLILVLGCSDFLEEESQDEVIVRMVSDYSELLLGEGYPDPAIPMYSCLYVFDDDLEVNDFNLSEDEDFALTLNYGCFTWQPDMWERVGKMEENYFNSYSRIIGCNAVLDGIDEAVGHDTDKQIVKGEALALRAYWYFNLVNLYGAPYNYDKESLGVPLKLTAGLLDNGIKRSSVKQVYEQIEKDMTLAVSLLKDKQQMRGNYRLNYASANILLSRIYLFMERWDDAIAAANEAIKTGGDLTNYTRISTVNYYFTDYDNSEVEWIFGADNKSIGMASMVPSKDLLSKFTSNDCRLNLYFSEDRMTVIKQQSRLSSPYNVLRISEAYLNRAEAFANKSDRIQSALDDLNKLRSNRIMHYENVTITDAKKLLEEIRLERRKELCFEEMRWFDLRRYGMPSIKHSFRTKNTEPWKVYTLNEKDPLYTLPIPQEMIIANRLLEQNISATEPLRQGN